MRQILRALGNGERLSAEQWEFLRRVELQDAQRAGAFEITSTNVQSVLEQRCELLKSLYHLFCQWCDRHLGTVESHLPTLWMVWLPLAQQLATQRQARDRPFVQGILGGQGTGKTTLGSVLTLILHHLGCRTLSWSLDDLYKTYRDRCQLQQQEPQLIWRGPPGTHDVELGIQTLDQLRQIESNKLIPVPRFDKSLHQGQGDRVEPEFVSEIDVVLFEGWFVGVHPISPATFDHPFAPITTDADRTFAQACNEQLRSYLPLWQRLDSLWVLYPLDYRLSKQWRKQAEHQMKQSGKSGMTDAEVDAFVDYFWKALHPELFIPPTLQRADLAIEIDANHAPQKIEKPSNL